MATQLHFDCFSGVSGDMTLAALIELGVPVPLLEEGLGSLGLPGRLVVEKVKKDGFAATRITVDTPHEHAHRHLSHIERIIDGGTLTDSTKALAKRLFRKLGEAEAASHGVPIEKVHFHEVGAVDSIFDFVGIAIGIDYLKPDRITSRPVPTGCGFVDCEHGRLPVPAPAVARLLTGIPLTSSTIETELTTPTGAAVLATLVEEFTLAPSITIEAIGHGAGTKDLGVQPNILRLFWGNTVSAGRGEGVTDTVWQVETNLDDVSGEVIGYAIDRLFEAGALDVFTLAMGMKKGRPGVMLIALCDDSKLDEVETMFFRETGTFGVRKRRIERRKLHREAIEVETKYGPVAGKLGWNGSIRIFTPEYEDCARIARDRNVPLRKVYQVALRQFEKSQATNE